MAKRSHHSIGAVLIRAALAPFLAPFLALSLAVPVLGLTLLAVLAIDMVVLSGLPTVKRVLS